MVFSSVVFLYVFLPLVLLCYALAWRFAGLRVANGILLIASLFFYFWGEGIFTLIMVLSIAINYFAGLGINAAGKTGNLNIKKLALAIGVLANLGLLFYFKYFDFSIQIANAIWDFEIPLKNILLPIGISFFTFQGMTYIIDLYRGTVGVQKNILKVALYISLFPQLI
ncbi:MAG: MBOAT family protein, partial [Hungatella sp.]